MARHFYFLLPEPFSIVVQVGLQDGTVALFDVNVPQEPLRRLESLAPILLLLLLVCFASGGLSGAHDHPLARSPGARRRRDRARPGDRAARRQPARARSAA